MVHRREVDGTAVVFGNQGALWGNAMTWWDHDTGSVWSQPLGEAIAGPRRGARLELLSSSLMPWGEWKQRHPGTLALDAPDANAGFDLDMMAIVVEIGDDSLATPVTELRQVGVVNTVVGGNPLAVVVLPGTDQWQVFSRVLDDRTIELELDDGRLTAVGGPLVFDPVLGLAERPVGAGGGATPDVGHDLLRLPGFTLFPRDYVTFFPDGAFWTREGVVPAILDE